MTTNSEDKALMPHCEELAKLLRLQRHDFINHLQVIHTMIQMGRTEKALQYISNLAQDTKTLEKLLQEFKNCCCRQKNRE